MFPGIQTIVKLSAATALAQLVVVAVVVLLTGADRLAESVEFLQPAEMDKMRPAHITKRIV